MNDTPNNSTAPVEAHIIEMMGDLVALARVNPRAIETIARLYDDDETRERFARKMLSILPAIIDADGMLQWLEGGVLPPAAVRLADPDKGRSKGARGAEQAARKRHNAAVAERTAAQAKLETAITAETDSAEALRRAESHLRLVTFGRFYNALGEQLAMAAYLGPVWTILRSISGHLQTDVAWENSLTIERREAIAAHRRERRESRTEMLDLLDRYCGDEELEIKLYIAIISVLRRFHREVEQELERGKYGGGKLSERAKRPRRTHEQWRTSVHPQGKLADRHAVLEGLQGGPDPAATDRN